MAYSSQNQFPNQNDLFPNPPIILIEPEVVFMCTYGGFVTIKPSVTGQNLSFSWQEFDGSSTTNFNTLQPYLTLGPINQRHLNSQYRMIATDQYRRSVATRFSRLQLMRPEHSYAEPLARSIRSDHIAASRKDIFSGKQVVPANTNLNFQRTLEKYHKVHNIHLPDINLGKVFKSCQKRIKDWSTLIETSNKKLERMISNDDASDNMYFPRFIIQPQNQNISFGALLKLESATTHFDNYLWYQNGIPLHSHKEKNLVISNVRYEDAGTYSVLAENQFGFKESEVIVVTVC